MKLTTFALSVAALAMMTVPSFATSSICQEQTIDGGTHQEDVFGDVTRNVHKGTYGGTVNGILDPMCVRGKVCNPSDFPSLSDDVGGSVYAAVTTNEKVGELTVDNPDIEQYREGDLNPVKTIIATIQNHQYTPVYDFDEWQNGSC